MLASSGTPVHCFRDAAIGVRVHAHEAPGTKELEAVNGCDVRAPARNTGLATEELFAHQSGEPDKPWKQQ
jgi:hypothetical protein